MPFVFSIFNRVYLLTQIDNSKSIEETRVSADPNAHLSLLAIQIGKTM